MQLEKEIAMFFLKQPIQSITYPLSYIQSFNMLVEKLHILNIEIKKKDKNKGILLVRCLSLAFNMILWRCYSDKMLFEIKSIKDDVTRIDISLIPNLFRIKVKKNEKLADINQIISFLKKSPSPQTPSHQ